MLEISKKDFLKVLEKANNEKWNYYFKDILLSGIEKEKESWEEIKEEKNIRKESKQEAIMFILRCRRLLCALEAKEK